MAHDTSRVGAQIFQALGALGQSNALRRQREDARRERRAQFRGALVGTAVGIGVGTATANPALGVGAGTLAGQAVVGQQGGTVSPQAVQAGALQTAGGIQQQQQTEARAGDIPPEQQPAQDVSGQPGALGFQAGSEFQPARGALSPDQRVRAGALNALDRGDTQNALALGQLAGALAPSRGAPGFTLSPGQTRFDAGGQPVASGGVSAQSQPNLTFREERNPQSGEMERVAIDPRTGEEVSRTAVGAEPTDQKRTFVVQGGTPSAEQFNVADDQTATVSTVNGQVEAISVRNKPSSPQSVTKAPSGFRFTDEGQTLEFIPGGPADPATNPADDAIFGGRGISSQDSNNLLDISEKVRTGGFDSLSPLEQQTYTLSYGRVSQPSVVTIGDQTIERPGLPLRQMGFPPPPAFAQREGDAPIPQTGGGNQPATVNSALPPGWEVIGNKPIPVTEAAKVAAVKGAKDALSTVKAAVIRKDGTIDRGLVTNMFLGTPFTEGRRRAQELRDALEARLRAESGAAVTESEFDRTLDRFMPSPFDSDAAIRSKFQRMEQYLSDTAFLSGRITAAKVAAVKGAKDALSTVKAAVIRKDGTIDRGLVTNMFLGTPFTEGRRRAQELRDALEARLRAESGAAVTESEFDRTLDRFMPSPFDSDAAIRSKFQRMEQYLSDTAFLSGRLPGVGTSQASTEDLNRRFNLEP